MLCCTPFMQPKSQNNMPNITLTCTPSPRSMHGQALRSKAHGQQLFQSKHCRLSILVVHQNRHGRLMCHHQVSFAFSLIPSRPFHSNHLPRRTLGYTVYTCHKDLLVGKCLWLQQERGCPLVVHLPLQRCQERYVRHRCQRDKLHSRHLRRELLGLTSGEERHRL
jgi:hypothetical protein